MTNEDKIRAMTVEQLAKYIAEEQINAIHLVLESIGEIDITCAFLEISNRLLKEIVEEKLAWLKQEAEND